MRVAIWDILPEELFAGPGRSVKGPVDFVSMPASEARESLDQGEVDAALLSTLAVLQDHDLFDAYPAVALSSWDYPFARLLLPGGLGERPTSLTHEPGRELEALVSRVILREHYGSEVEVSVRDSADVPNGSEARSGEATVLVAGDAEPIESASTVLDLGREWFELVNYPMVWGVFVSAKGSVTDDSIRLLRDAIIRADMLREKRAQSIEDDVPRDFMENHVRLRLDDLAVASLTELYNYVYYYGAVTDFTTIPFVELKETEEEGDEDHPFPS